MQLTIAVFSPGVHVPGSFYVSVYGYGFSGGGWKLVCMCLRVCVCVSILASFFMLADYKCMSPGCILLSPSICFLMFLHCDLLIFCAMGAWFQLSTGCVANKTNELWVHIDPFSAMNGISLFCENELPWR